jgi:hypothetical protein
MSYVSEFTTDIRHVAGKENIVADALSRPAAVVAPSTSGRLDWHAIARDQTSCDETQELRGSTSLAVSQVTWEGVAVWCDTSTGVLRPLVPKTQRKAVFMSVHSLAHPGIRATRRLITSRYVWRGCAADVQPRGAESVLVVHVAKLLFRREQNQQLYQCQRNILSTCTWI